MGEECLVTGIHKFQRGDYVAIASNAACFEFQLSGSVRASHDKSSYFEKVGKVDNVTPFGDVQVTFGRELRCAIAPKYLVKVRNLLPGDLVKLVDDIRGFGNLTLEHGEAYKAATKDCGHICLVLDNCVPKAGVIYVTLGEEYKKFSPLHLDFVARPLYGDFMARVKEYACISDVSLCLTDNLFTALQDSMQDLPDVRRFASSKSSPYHPGTVVKVSSDVKEFIRWQLNDSSRETQDPSTTKFQRLQDFARLGLYTSDKQSFPTEQVVSLTGHGKVVHVNTDGDAIVEFSDGRAWCIRPSFLQLVEDTDACIEGSVPCSPRKLSEGIDNMIRHALCHGPKTTATLLHAACFSGNMDLIEIMLEGSVGLECEDANGNKPLHYAAHGNQPDVVKFLLRKGANINATNKHRQTALHFAVREGFVSCVRELMKHHLTLDANIQDDTGNTALHVAIARMDPQIVSELIEPEEVNYLLSDIYGLNALHLAALKGNASVAEKIISRAKDLVNLKQQDQGYTPLHFAAVSGHYDLVEMLLGQEICHVDLLNKHEETALLLAAKEGHWNIVELLILAGANINKKDRNGNTALHISLAELEERSAKEIIMPSSLAMNAVEKKLVANGRDGVEDRLLLPCFLVRCGADTRCANKDKKNPLELASNLKGPAAELLGFFSVERRDADSGKCKFCLEESANLEFRPCGHCLYCDNCGGRMKRCLNCREFITEMVPVSPSNPSNPNKEPIKVNKAEKPILGPEVYTMQQKPRGLCIIINNVDFEGSQKPRPGSEIDSLSMNALFTGLHFDVRVYTNLSAEDMRNALFRAAKSKEQEKADCLVVFLMSHGSNGVIYGIDNKAVNLRQEVYPLFNNDKCPALKGKPKLFFVQACRGGKENSATVDATDTFAVDAGSRPVLPEWSDMYFAYATIPDYVAIRNIYKGSWFISAIYCVFCEHAATTDLDGLMCKVTRKVMQNSTDENIMQTTNPDLCGWRKKFYFNPGYWV